MASRVTLIWLVLFAVLLSGCDSAEDLVNRRLPPVPAEQHHAAAIQSARAAVAGLSVANAGFNLRMEDIAATLNASGISERLGVAPVKLRADRQLILAEVDVARKFARGDFPELDAGTQAQIDALRPEITGKITLGLGLSTRNAQTQDGRATISVHLLPAFRNMKVARVDLTGTTDVDLLVTLMNRLADRMAGEIGQVEIARASFPTIPIKHADLARSIALRTGDGTEERITASAQPVSSSYQVRSSAWLVDSDNVTVIAELAPVGTAPVASSTASPTEDYDALKSEFSRKLAEGLNVANPGEDNWIAVSKPILAQLITAAFRQGRPCIAMKVSLASQDFSRPLGIPDTKAMDCTPNIDCRPSRDCNPASRCKQAEDCRPARSCQVCALGACFDDPACARENAALRHNCEVKKAGRELDCQSRPTAEVNACLTEVAAEKASCEARKTAKQISCEAGRLSLAKLAEAGTAANLAGTVRGTGDIAICIKEFAVAPSLDKVEASAVVNGQGSVDFGISYVPLGIADRFDCRFPWTESKSAKVALADQPVKLDAGLTLDSSTPDPTLKLNVRTSALATRPRTSVRDLILSSYDMRGACAPVGGMINAATLDAAKAVPEIDSDFVLPGVERSLVLTMETIALEIAGRNVVAKATYGASDKALILDGDRSALPAN